MRHLVVLFLCVQLIHAQTPSDWRRVQNLAPGKAILLKTKAGDRYQGKLASAMPDSILVNTDERSFPGRRRQRREFQQSAVKEIRLQRPAASTLTWLAIGAGIGAGVGAGVGAAIGRSRYSRDRDDSEIWTTVGLMFGTGAGAAGGFLFGMSTRKRVMVYDAR